jgi:hypothetical protein
MTFQSLEPGEVISLPASWPQMLGAVEQVGVGLPHTTLGAFSGGGAYGTVCTPVTMSIDQARQNLEAVIAANPTICSNSTGEYPRDQSVCDFQAAYNASGLSPGIQLDSTLASNLDAELGPNSLSALNTYLSSVSAGYTWACANGLATKVMSGGGGGALVPVPMLVGDAYNALINDPSLCGGGGAITATPLQTVINFQAAYNATTPPPASLLTVNGVFDGTTLTALNAASATIGGPIYDGTCGNPTAGYLSYTLGTAPNPQVPGGASMTTKLLLGGLALAAGAGAFWYLHKHQGHAGAGAAPHATASTHRLAAHRRR